jgi:hypothetical protein
MKRNLLFVAVIGLLFSGVFVARALAEEPKNERAVVQFTETVKLKGVLLRGQYLVIHDADKMMKGEDCTWIYDSKGKLVMSFHCRPVDRASSDTFKIIVSRTNAAFSLPEVLEIQFPGSTEGHQVP